MTPFYAGQVDIWAGFINDEVLKARERGYQVNLILPGYYGVHLYGMVLFATEARIRKNPGLVLRFLRATLEGWRWAIENPLEAASLPLHYDPALDRAHEQAALETGIPLIHTGEGRIGSMRSEVWRATHELLREQAVVHNTADAGEIYTMEFLQRIYGDRR